MAGRLRTGLIVLLLAGGVAGAIGWSRAREVSPAAPQAAAATVAPPQSVELAGAEVAKVAPQTLTRTVRVSGSAEPRRVGAVNAQVSGQLAEVGAEVGQEVEAGEVIARFDTVVLRSALAAQEATLEAKQAQRRLAASTLERSRRLGSAGISSEATLLQAEAELLGLEAEVRGLEAGVADARKSLSDAEVKAPFAGIVSERSVEPGQSVPVNTQLFKVVDLSEMEIEALVPTSRIADVRLGQTAHMRVEGSSGRMVEARVTRIAPVAVAGSRAVRVYLSVPNGEGLLRGGLFATGEVEVESFPDVIALPAGAIRRDEEGAFVLAARSGRLHRQPVQLGADFADRGLVEVARGVAEGDVVVTAPLPDLKPDVEVSIADLG
ncbi:efflux RND transporter periplasmic adaptor subunit [Aureimonas sp. AU20]|uniref:efflux RND transporter periplasmic adaptor subunit n=1 Tax=Aureimonas sp. AU20 TaxID=1349819 RepID=UPI00071FDA97|nr:efflux RND transporter periplasmic adaptor subunit [Aureimonas sp. AU20]ALN72506.1 hypothetical protein M673_07260 [Aureimonas sp. AU20]